MSQSYPKYKAPTHNPTRGTDIIAKRSKTPQNNGFFIFINTLSLILLELDLIAKHVKVEVDLRINNLVKYSIFIGQIFMR